MKKGLYLIVTGLLVACATAKTTVPESQALAPVQTHINAIRQQYAPDRRTAIFDVEADGQVLKGETTIPAAKTALLEQLQAANIPFRDSILVLPEPELAGKQAVVTLSVANLRTEPRHPAELATQATLGTPLRVWKKSRGWYLVQTPDAYLAWVDGGGIALLDEAKLDQWRKTTKLLYTHPYGFAYDTPNPNSATISDLVYGDVLSLKSRTRDFYEVSFPDGRTAFVPITQVTLYQQWAASRRPTAENLVQTAKQMLGIPYLWGGTSFKGVDCSGFTKTVYFMNGLVLPRDASQQVHLGETVEINNSWQHLKPGDLLFFGSPANNGKPERVVHVGMWIGGNQEFIHSASRVQISSLNPEAPNYDASEHKRLLRVKRISPEAALFDLRRAAIFE